MSILPKGTVYIPGHSEASQYSARLRRDLQYWERYIREGMRQVQYGISMQAQLAENEAADTVRIQRHRADAEHHCSLAHYATYNIDGKKGTL